ncbi:hypothetical protein DMI69_02430 [Escherichia coli]|nr:hypothetical protein [Escherichia coli]
MSCWHLCDGERTEEGMRANIRVAVQYIEAWISAMAVCRFMA